MAAPYAPPAQPSHIPSAQPNRPSQLLLTAVAAFIAYFCMYAYRKPFTAATFGGMEAGGMDFKSLLVLSQLLGYTLSKFIGIRVVSEMPGRYRAITILGLIGFSEAALIGFALLPNPLKVLMIFLNGLPLGMVFGLILSYLEGRKQTEALTAALCASFIVSSGAVKTVGTWLLDDIGISQFSMPATVGVIFAPMLLLSVWILQRTPPPDHEDLQLRSERGIMSSRDRRKLFHHYWPGLTMLICVYVALTIARTIRDDFAVEIWREMGVVKRPVVFTTSETLVGITATVACGLLIWFRDNWQAMRITILAMCASFGLIALSILFLEKNWATPYWFMVLCGIGLYLPYVAFHTTVFERLIAVARMPGNLGFLMYLADSIGYLGYAIMIVARNQFVDSLKMLPLFKWTLLVVSAVSVCCLVTTYWYLQRKLTIQGRADLRPLPEAS